MLRETAIALVLLGSPVAPGQDTQAFLRAAGQHFGVARDEVAILSEWQIPAEEIPVVLHMAGRAGVSPDALLALRRSGRSWADLMGRYGIHAGQLHVRLTAPPSLGPLGRAYAAYADRPGSAWQVIRLDDDAVVQLVNLRFLSEFLETSPDRVAAALAESGSVLEAFRLLRRSALP